MRQNPKPYLTGEDLNWKPYLSFFLLTNTKRKKVPAIITIIITIESTKNDAVVPVTGGVGVVTNVGVGEVGAAVAVGVGVGEVGVGEVGVGVVARVALTLIVWFA